jgi:hypothetical protein
MQFAEDGQDQMMLLSALGAVLSAILWLFDILAMRILILSVLAGCLAVPLVLVWIYRRPIARLWRRPAAEP